MSGRQEVGIWVVGVCIGDKRKFKKSQLEKKAQNNFRQRIASGGDHQKGKKNGENV
jgi:hypothetical protein